MGRRPLGRETKLYHSKKTSVRRNGESRSYMYFSPFSSRTFFLSYVFRVRLCTFDTNGTHSPRVLVIVADFPQRCTNEYLLHATLAVEPHTLDAICRASAKVAVIPKLRNCHPRAAAFELNRIA